MPTTSNGPNTPTDALLLKIPDAARLLNISRSTVYELVAAGVLPSVRISDRIVRIPADALNAWIIAKTEGVAR